MTTVELVHILYQWLLVDFQLMETKKFNDKKKCFTNNEIKE